MPRFSASTKSPQNIVSCCRLLLDVLQNGEMMCFVLKDISKAEAMKSSLTEVLKSNLAIINGTEQLCVEHKVITKLYLDDLTKYGRKLVSGIFSIDTYALESNDLVYLSSVLTDISDTNSFEEIGDLQSPLIEGFSTRQIYSLFDEYITECTPLSLAAIIYLIFNRTVRKKISQRLSSYLDRNDAMASLVVPVHYYRNIQKRMKSQGLSLEQVIKNDIDSVADSSSQLHKIECSMPFRKFIEKEARKRSISVDLLVALSSVDRKIKKSRITRSFLLQNIGFLFFEVICYHHHVYAFYLP